MDAIINNQVELENFLKNVYFGHQHFFKLVAPQFTMKISLPLVLLRDASLQVFDKIQAHLHEFIRVHQHILDANNHSFESLEMEIRGQLAELLNRTKRYYEKEKEKEENFKLQLADLKENILATKL